MSRLNTTRSLLMVIPTPDVVSVFVVTISLAILPDAVRFDKPVMRLRLIATSAPSDIPVLLQLMTGVLCHAL